MKKRRFVLVAALALATAASPALAKKPTHQQFNSWWFVNSVTAQRIHNHLERLQRIASRNDDTRALGTPGYKASVRYIVDRLKWAHYHPVVQPFTANLFEEHSPPELARLSPSPKTFVADTDFTTMQYSGAGNIASAELIATNDIVLPPSPAPSSTSGCETTDFPANTSGKIVLIQRGACTFLGEDNRCTVYESRPIACRDLRVQVGAVLKPLGVPNRSDHGRQSTPGRQRAGGK